MDLVKTFEDGNLLASNRIHLVFQKHHTPFSSVAFWHHQPKQNAIQYRTIYLTIATITPSRNHISLNPKLVRHAYMKPYLFNQSIPKAQPQTIP